MANRLYMVRHGENVANLTRQFSHRKIDFALTEKGLLQAQQTAEALRGCSIDAIYCSPLKRALQTAQIIGATLALPVTVIEELRETNVGELDGRPGNEEDWRFHNEILEAWFAGRANVRFPGGEDYASLWARAQAAIAQMVTGRTEQNIVAVGHGGMFSVTIKDLCPQADVHVLRTMQNHNCAITEVLVNVVNGQVVGELVRWADHSHLHDRAADFVPGIPQAADWEG